MNMPEIVFVMSHYYSNYNVHYDDYDHKNIMGVYVTNKGEIKFFDFGKFTHTETYSIPDVYDQLEEATCDDVVISENIRLDELLDYYELLMNIDKDAEINAYQNYEDVIYGQYNWYGLRSNSEGTQELIYIYGFGDAIYENKDINAQDLYMTIGIFIEDIYRQIDYKIEEEE